MQVLLYPYLLGVGSQAESAGPDMCPDDRTGLIDDDRHGITLQGLDHLFLHLHYSLQIAGGVIGYLHGLSLHDLPESVPEPIGGTYFEPIWRKLDKELELLCADYPNWVGSIRYAGLASVILALWNTFGVYPSMKGEGIWVDIACSPEGSTGC